MAFLLQVILKRYKKLQKFITTTWFTIPRFTHARESESSDTLFQSENAKEIWIEKKRGESLGVALVESGWGSILPTVILANIQHSSPAERSGKLNIGDQIMSVNGTSLVGLPLSSVHQGWDSVFFGLSQLFQLSRELNQSDVYDWTWFLVPQWWRSLSSGLISATSSDFLFKMASSARSCAEESRRKAVFELVTELLRLTV